MSPRYGFSRTRRPAPAGGFLGVVANVALIERHTLSSILDSGEAPIVVKQQIKTKV
jgi:hypothetical protein